MALLIIIFLVPVLPSTLVGAKIRNNSPFSQELLYSGDSQITSAWHVCVMTEVGVAYSESRIQASSLAQEGSSEGQVQFSGC